MTARLGLSLTKRQQLMPVLRCTARIHRGEVDPEGGGEEDEEGGTTAAAWGAEEDKGEGVGWPLRASSARPAAPPPLPPPPPLPLSDPVSQMQSAPSSPTVMSWLLSKDQSRQRMALACTLDNWMSGRGRMERQTVKGAGRRRPLQKLSG